jgi:hypothetical protein
VTASTTTTIRGVSILSRQRKGKADVFDIALSSNGIAIQRRGRSDQHMSWERISQWEIEERPDCVVLTLRGGGSVTPLMVKGWTPEDLETVMREATAASTTGRAAAGTPAAAAADAAEAAPDSEPGENGTPAVTPVQPRAARRLAARRTPSRAWKMFVTIVLLGALATAVTVVLLQSAGVISWSFLGPVA